MKKTPTWLLIVEYIVGILLLICSIQMFADSSIAGGIIMIASGLICIPATRSFLEQKIKKQLSGVMKFVIVVFGWLSIAIFGKNPVVAESKKDAAVIPAAQNKAPSTIQAVAADTTVITASVPAVENNNTAEEVTTESLAQIADTSSLADNSNTETVVAGLPVEKKSTSKRSSYGESNTSGSNGYQVGPRGGCYYINAKGKKVYVDHSYCQ